MSELKAYEVFDGDEGWAIVFAEKAVQARRYGANELDIEFGEVDFCRRLKWADRYADVRSVPMSEAIRHGWWTECTCCGQRLHEDEVWAAGIEPAAVIGTIKGRAYCDWTCWIWDLKVNADLEARKQRAIRWLKRRVLRRFPGVDFANTKYSDHAYVTTDGTGRMRTHQAWVSFNFPGQQIAPATLRYDPDDHEVRRSGNLRPFFMCCAGDKAAFEAFAATAQQAAA